MTPTSPADDGIDPNFYEAMYHRTKAAEASGVPVTVSLREAREFARNMYPYTTSETGIEGKLKLLLYASARKEAVMFCWPCRVRPIRVEAK